MWKIKDIISSKHEIMYDVNNIESDCLMIFGLAEQKYKEQLEELIKSRDKNLKDISLFKRFNECKLLVPQSDELMKIFTEECNLTNDITRLESLIAALEIRKAELFEGL